MRVVAKLADLARLLHEQLEEHERKFLLPARYETNNGRFADLIIRLHQQTCQRVVVLVDACDRPILDRLDDPISAREIREELNNICCVIKDQDADIRFAMLTGVSKFSKVSLFSGHNNLNDITLDPEWSALCGYTADDVDTVFAPELAGLDREQVCSTATSPRSALRCG